MTSSCNSMKHLSLEEVKKVIDTLGEFSESTLYKYSLTLIINKTGEATFTSCGWKLLDEIGCSCPLSKLISNAAKNYTLFCGDDCKYFLFILKEMFSAIYNKIHKENELLMRKEIINEVYSMKLVLPCIFKSIQDLSTGNSSGFDSLSFTKDLNSIVLTFMLSRFSVSVSKVLSSLICDFIQNICDMDSLQIVLAYVVSQFDIFCCKILSPLSESQVINGFLFYTKFIPYDLTLKDVSFIIVWDLMMKVTAENVAWTIKDESFIAHLNPMHTYKNILDYFKSLGIMLIFTPSSCNKDLKLLCKKNNIFLFDQLETKEINHLLTCFQLYPLDDLNESLETKHIGKLSHIKSKSFNKSNFLHLMCSNSVRFLKAHHILLSAPCSAIWKEYYSECLNCFKMILQWLSPQANLCFRKRLMNEVPSENEVKFTQLSLDNKTEECDCCSKIKLKFGNATKIVEHLEVVKPGVFCGVLLPPCSWEIMFKTAVEKVIEDSVSPGSIVMQATHLAISKSICKRIGVPFVAMKDSEDLCNNYIKKCSLGDLRYLEPVVCKEVMISNILDLILQLLKIDSIVFVK